MPGVGAACPPAVTFLVLVRRDQTRTTFRARIMSADMLGADLHHVMHGMGGADGIMAPDDHRTAMGAAPPSTASHNLLDLSYMDNHQPHLTLLAGAPLLILSFVLVLFCLRKAFGFGTDSAGRSKAGGKGLPSFAFDVEGGSADHGGGKALHPSIAQAAEQADVTLLRDWTRDERCTIDAKMAATGWTALHTGAAKGHANVCRLLLDAGADVLCVDNELRTPLHLVAENGHGLCVKALLEAGGDPETKDAKGRTPLQLADSGRHMGTARMMRLHLERRSMHAAADGAHAGARRR